MSFSLQKKCFMLTSYFIVQNILKVCTQRSWFNIITDFNGFIKDIIKRKCFFSPYECLIVRNQVKFIDRTVKANDTYSLPLEISRFHADDTYVHKQFSCGSMDKSPGLGVTETWVQSLSLKLSEPQFPHL